MNDSSNRKLETCRRVKDFCNARAADFSATSLATQLFRDAIDRNRHASKD